MKRLLNTFSVVLVVVAALILLSVPAYSYRGGGHGYSGGHGHYRGYSYYGGHRGYYGGHRGYYGGYRGYYGGYGYYGGGYPYWGGALRYRLTTGVAIPITEDTTLPIVPDIILALRTRMTVLASTIIIR